MEAVDARPVRSPITCNNNYWLAKYDTECLMCPTEGFITVGNTCEPCPTNCKTCSRNSNGMKTCNLCLNGFLLNDDCSFGALQCVPCTGERDFPYETECKVGCVSDLNCVDCMNESECAKCSSGWYISLSNKAQCVTCLQEGNYKYRDLLQNCLPFKLRCVLFNINLLSL